MNLGRCIAKILRGCFCNLDESCCVSRGVRWDQIFLGVGSDEAIDMIMRIFCSPGRDSILITPPTYGMYSVSAKVNDVEVQKAPLMPSFDVDVEKVPASFFFLNLCFEHSVAGLIFHLLFVAHSSWQR